MWAYTFVSVALDLTESYCGIFIGLVFTLASLDNFRKSVRYSWKVRMAKKVNEGKFDIKLENLLPKY